MAKSFNLTAELNLRGPSNIKKVVADIRRQLGTVQANVNINLSANAIKNATALNRTLKDLNGTLRNTVSAATRSSQAINNLSKTFATFGSVTSSASSVNNLSKSVSQLSSASANVTPEIKAAKTEMQEFGKQSALAIRRFAAFTTVSTAIFALTRSITQGVQAFIDFDKELTRVQQVTGETRAGLNDLVSTINSLSTGFGVSSKDLTTVSVTLAQAGFSARETAKALKALALSDLAPTFDNLNQTVEGSIALLRQFNIGAVDLEKALGAINAVSAKFAVESSDIIAAIQRSGGVFATASKGVSEGTDALNEFIAVFTSVRATTRESAETIATGLRTIFTRIQRGKTIEALKEFGVTLTDAEGKFVGAFKAIQLLSEGLSKIDPRDIKFSEIVEELGGFRQIGKVIPLIQQFSTAQEALKVAQQGQDSLARDAVVAQISLANQIAKTREQFLTLFRDIGTTDTFQNITQGALGLASALISVADSIKGILPILGIIGAIKGVSALTQFTSGFIGGLKKVPGNAGGGKILGFNRGGIVPGSGRGDKVPALLEPGEVVISNQAAQKYGRGNLVRMNKYVGGGSIKERIGKLPSEQSILYGAKPGFTVDDKKGEVETQINPIPIKLISQDFFTMVENIRDAYRTNKKQFIKFRDEKAIGSRGETPKSIYSKKSLSIGDNDEIEGPFISLPKPDKSSSWAKGRAFEKLLADKYGSITGKPRSSVDDNSTFSEIIADQFSPLDFETGDAKFEKKAAAYFSKGINTQKLTILSKRFRDSQLVLPWTPNIDSFVGPQALEQTSVFYPENPEQTKRDFDTFYEQEYNKALRSSSQTLEAARQAFYKGGKIQKFAIGGKALGARSKFKELTEAEISQLSTKDLIAYAKAQARDIFTTGGSGIAVGSEFIEVPQERIIPELESELTTYLGKRGFWREKVAPFGSVSKTRDSIARKMDSRTLRKMVATAGGVDSSALENVPMDTLLKYAEQAPRAPQEALEKTIAKYSNISSIKPKFQAWGKNPSGGIFGDVVAGFEDEIRNQLDEPNKSRFDALIKAGSLDAYKADGGKDGHIPPLKKAIYEITGVTDQKIGGLIQRLNAGGLVRGFEDGSVGGVATALDPTLEKLIQQIAEIGGTTQLYKFVDKPEIDDIIRSKGLSQQPQAKDIVSSTWLRKQKPDRFGDRSQYAPALKEIVNRAKERFSTEQSGIQAQILRNLQAAEGGAYQFGLASIFGPNGPGDFGYSSVSDARLIKTTDGQEYLTQIIRKSLPARYENDIKDASEDIRNLSQKTGERLQYTDIFGTSGPLAFDFDETLVKGADIYNEKGKIDALAYNDLNRVQQSLKNAKLTLLGQELKNRLTQYPELMDNIRVLTARPQSNAPLLASKLASLGLPIPEDKITGVSGGLNKVANLSELETLIDDNLENIQSVTAGGKKAIQYKESQPISIGSRSTTAIEGYVLEEMVRGWGINVNDDEDPTKPIDFEKGLGSFAASKWDMPPNIPTDTKRTNTSTAASVMWDRAESFYKRNFVAAFAQGGVAKQPKVSFGTGEFPFPKRISNAYFKEIDKVLEAQKIKDVWDINPKNERIIPDQQAIQAEYNKSFDKGMFLTTFKDRISKNTLFQRMGEFAKFIGLPQEDLSAVLPQQIDFGVPGMLGGALFSADPTGPKTRGLQKVDLSQYGFSEQDKQDVFGYGKLFEEKQKAVNKIVKTPVQTFEDGSFSYDSEAAQAVWKEMDELKKKISEKGKIQRDASDRAKAARMKMAEATGRGGVSIDSEGFSGATQKYNVLYHELTHQLFQSLRVRNSESFDKYKEKVVSLFEGDNDDLAEAFDSITDYGYKSADVVYGRSYKLSTLQSLASEIYRRSEPSEDRKNLATELAGSISKSKDATRAKAFKPINPNVNSLLMKSNIDQATIDKMEDNGKEEFLTTLVQNAPALDANLSSILDDTLTSLLASANIQRQQFAVGGLIGKFNDGGIVPAMVSNGEAFVPPQLAKKIGYSKLDKMNQADRNGMKGFAAGGISTFKGSGSGTSDSIGPIGLPEGSYVIRAKATRALGLNKGGSIGVQSFFAGGRSKKKNVIDETFEAVESFQPSSSQANKALDQALENLLAKIVKSISDANPTISFDDALARAQKDSAAGSPGAANLALKQAAEAGDQSAAKAVANSQRQQVNAIIKEIRSIDKSVSITEARAAAERKVADAWGGLWKQTKQTTQQLPTTTTTTSGSFGAGESSTLTRSLASFGEKLGSNTTLIFSSILPTITSLYTKTIDTTASKGAATIAAALEGVTTGASTGLALGGQLTSTVASFVKDGPIKEAISAFGGVGTVVASLGLAVGQAIINFKNAAIEFDKADAKKKLDNALDSVSKSFDELSKDVKNIDLQDAIVKKLQEAGDQAAKILEIQSNTVKGSFATLLSGDLFKNGQQASQRSTILERLGTFEYINSFNEEIRKVKFASLIPQLASENAKLFAEIASNTNKIIEEKLRGGASFGDLIADVDFKSFARNIANADSAIQDRILRIQNSGLEEDEKAARIATIQAIYAENEIRKRAAVIEAEQRTKEAEKSANLFSRSLERMFQNMEQSIGRTTFELDRMKDSIDLVSSSLTGQAKAGNAVITSLNVLANPRAYSERDRSEARSQASSLFVGNRNILEGLLTVGDNIEGRVLSTINQTLRDGASDGANNEVIAASIEKAVRKELADLRLPPDVSSKIANQVREGIAQLRKDNDDKIDFTDLVEKIPALSKVIDSAKRAQEVAIKALEVWQNSLNNYSSAINQLTDLQIETNNRLRQANKLVINSQIELAKTLGKDVDLTTLTRARNVDIAARTGGATDPTAIFNKILQLENRRKGLQSAVDATANIGPSAVATNNFIKLNQSLKNNNVALREAYDALKELADNGDLASAALSKVQEAQQKTAARAGFLEKLVTSTPEELNNLNNSFFRLQRNLAGQTNTIQNSIGAQKAYFEALNNGSSAFEAIQAAQQAFVNERKETLDVFNQILPFLGQGQQANDMRANVLQSMLAESGFAMTPMFQDMINAIRNPEADPETKAAIDEYKKAVNLQSEANKLLGQLNNQLANEIANKSATALTESLSKLKFTFQATELSDIRTEVIEIRKLLSGDRPVAPVARADGGIIYASAGRAIDFSPKGTDTVPAMLTPGEFVVNRRATSNNLGLLQSINSGNYASGGKVKYYSDGGYVSSIDKDITGLIKTKDSFVSFEDIKKNKPVDVATIDKAFQTLDTTYSTKDNTKPTNTKFTEQNTLYGTSPSISKESAPFPEQPGFLFYKNSADGLNIDTSLSPGAKSFQTEQIAKNNFEEYARAIRNYSSGLFAPTGIFTSIKPISDLSKSGSANFWNPQANSLAGLLVSTSETRDMSRILEASKQDFINSPKTDKLYGQDRWLSYTRAALRGLVLSKNTPEAKYAYYSTSSLQPIPYSGSSESIDPSSIPLVTWLTDRDSIDKFAKKHDDNSQLLKNSLDQLRNVEYNSDISGYDSYQNKLKNLLNGSPYESFGADEANFLDYTKLSTKDIKALYVLNNKYREALANISYDSEDFDSSFKATRDFSISESAKRGFGGSFFPWIINADPSEVLGSSIGRRKSKFDEKTASGESLGFKSTIESLTGNLTVGDYKLPYSVAYKKYEGKRYDEANKKLTNDVIKGALVGYDNNENSIFNTKNATLKNQAYGFGDAASIVSSIDTLKNNADIKKYLDSLSSSPIDIDDINLTPDRLFNKINNDLKNKLGITDLATDVFSGFSNNPYKSVDVTSWITEAAKSALTTKGEEAKQAVSQRNAFGGDSALNQDSLRNLLSNLLDGSVKLFQSKPGLPGLGKKWLGQFNRVRNILKNSRKSIELETLKQYSTQASNVFGFVAGQADQIFKGLTNTQSGSQNRIANFVQELGILTSGANSAFNILSSGRTGFLDSFISSDNIDQLENMFRTLGFNRVWSGVQGQKLQEGYKDSLAQQLQGSKIRTIDKSGKITTKDFAETDLSDKQSLVDLAFNPYNEFPNQFIRKRLIDEIIDDVKTATDSNGRKLFNNDTSQFIEENAKNRVGTRLYVGDRILDPTTTATDREDELKFIRSMGNFYDYPYNILGFKNKFGPLPDTDYYEKRLLVEPQALSSGGTVYASKGSYINFQPKGTDTVPAMLTPGEFVVNRAATQKNLPLLQSINSGSVNYNGSGMTYAADGGTIMYRGGKQLTEEEMAKIRGKELAEKLKWNISEDNVDSWINQEPPEVIRLSQADRDALYDYQWSVSDAVSAKLRAQADQARSEASQQKIRDQLGGFDNVEDYAAAQKAKSEKEIKDAVAKSMVDFEEKKRQENIQKQLKDYAVQNTYDVAANNPLGEYMRSELAAGRIPNSEKVSQLKSEVIRANGLANQQKQQLKASQKKEAFIAAFGREPSDQELSGRSIQEIQDEGQYQQLRSRITDFISGSSKTLSTIFKDVNNRDFYTSLGVGLNEAVTGAKTPDEAMRKEIESQIQMALAIRNNLDSDRLSMNYSDRSNLYRDINSRLNNIRQLGMGSFVQDSLKGYEESLDSTRDISIDALTALIPGGAALKAGRLGSTALKAAVTAGSAGAFSGLISGGARGMDEASKENLIGTDATQKIMQQSLFEGSIGLGAGALFGGASIAGGNRGARLAQSLGDTKIGRGISGAFQAIQEKLPKSFKELDDLLITKLTNMTPEEFYAKEAAQMAKNAQQAAAAEAWLEKQIADPFASLMQTGYGLGGDFLQSTGNLMSKGYGRLSNMKRPSVGNNILDDLFNFENLSFPSRDTRSFRRMSRGLGDVDSLAGVDRLAPDIKLPSNTKPVTATSAASQAANQLSAKAQKYLATMPRGQLMSFQDLVKNATPEKQDQLLMDMIENAANSGLKWVDDPMKSQSFLAKLASKAQDSAQATRINKARGAYSPSEKAIVINKNARESTGVHEAAHYVADMSGKYGMDYAQLKSVIGDNLDKFLDGPTYRKLVDSLESGYSGVKIRQNPDELFTVLNQAASDKSSRKIFESSLEAKEILSKLWKAYGYNKGGIVYANKGTLVPYQPRGSDTVPAMLTPGEFVVNREATKDNLGLLQNINSGGVVYASGGGRLTRDERLENQKKRREESRERYLAEKQQRRGAYDQKRYLSTLQPQERQTYLANQQQVVAPQQAAPPQQGAAPQQPLPDLQAQILASLVTLNTTATTIANNLTANQQNAGGAPQGATTTNANNLNTVITISPEANEFLTKLTSSINNFGSYIDKLSGIFPGSIDMNINFGELVVRIEGAAGLDSLGERVKQDVLSIVDNKIRDMETLLNNVTGGEVSPPR